MCKEEEAPDSEQYKKNMCKEEESREKGQDPGTAIKMR